MGLCVRGTHTRTSVSHGREGDHHGQHWAGALEGGGQRADSQLQDTGALGCGGRVLAADRASLAGTSRKGVEPTLSSHRAERPACLLFIVREAVDVA